MIIGAYFWVRYTICYRLGSIMLMGVYCVGKVQIMLLGIITIMVAYCVGKVQIMLPSSIMIN